MDKDEKRNFDNWGFNESNWFGLISLIAVAAIFGERNLNTKNKKNQIENKKEN